MELFLVALFVIAVGIVFGLVADFFRRRGERRRARDGVNAGAGYYGFLGGGGHGGGNDGGNHHGDHGGNDGGGWFDGGGGWGDGGGGGGGDGGGGGF